VRDHPESYHTAWLLADQYWRRGDVNQSAFYWEAAVLLWPRDSQLLLEFANFNIGQKNWTRAIQLLEQSRAMHPWVPRVHEMLAFSYVHAGRPADALAAANEAARLGSATGILFAVRATAYEQLGRYDEGIGAWRSAIRQQRGTLWLYHAMLVRALARSQRTDAALAAADSALSLQHDSLPSRVISDVRTAVSAGCYAGTASPDCADPLAGWTIAVNAPPVADRRPVSQNATRPEVRY
jgi:tetratricopeptide (TPR) repeat protein